MTPTRDLLDGIGDLLTEADIGTYDDDATEVIVDTATVITLGKLSLSHPRAVALSAYTVTDDPTMPTDVEGLQVRMRGLDERDLADLADAIFDELHGAMHVDLSTEIHIDACYRRFSAPLGYDSANRPERSDNYYLTIARPTQHRNP